MCHMRLSRHVSTRGPFTVLNTDNVCVASLRRRRYVTVIHRMTQAQDSSAAHANHFTELQPTTLFGNVDILHLSSFTGKQTVAKGNQNPCFATPHSVLFRTDPIVCIYDKPINVNILSILMPGSEFTISIGFLFVACIFFPPLFFSYFPSD